MKKHLALLALAAASLWACSRSEIIPEPVPAEPDAVSLTFHANTEAPTRATLDTDASGIFRWQTGDRIGLFTSSGISAMDLGSGAGETSATFTGTVSGTPKDVALFPYRAEHTLASNKASFWLPTEYTYEAGRTNAAMAATGVTLQGNDLTGSFKHLGGLLQFSVSEIPAAARYFQFIAEGRKVSGSFTFNTGVEEPEITTADATEGNYVQIGFSSSDYASGMVFYVPVPTGTYSSFSVRLLDASMDVIAEKKAVRPISVARADVIRMSLTMDEVPSGQVIVSAATKRSFVYISGGKPQYVYQGTSNTIPAVGDYVTISGGTSNVYNGIQQLQYTTVSIKSSGNCVSYPVPHDITAEFDSYTNTEPEFISFTGTLSLSGNYYNVKVEDATKMTGSVLYPPDAFGLDALAGKKLKFTGYYGGISSSKYQNIVAVAVEEVFDTTDPVLVTGAASQVTMSTATLSAKYYNLPLTPYAPTEVRMVYGTAENALTGTVYADNITSETGTYSVNLASLEAGTRYYYKAVVSIWDAEAGKYVDLEGEVKSFTTRSESSGGNTGLQYLDCYEVPFIDLADDSGYTDSGPENWGTTSWYRYATTNTDQQVITHTYQSSYGKEVRNYTVLYDTDKFCPVWVAQAFNTGMYPDNNIGREGSWTFDPAISSNYQSTGGISEYDRGHLCASSDRQDTYYANYETFYYTNQAPQWASFNQGIWNTGLEQKIQGIQPSGTDTLYVVTGTLFEDGDDRQTSSNNKEVLIPSHFYKCLMLCSFNASGEMTAAKGIAYLFTNADHSGASLSTFQSTIDEVEQRSGFDFFCNVPAEYQEAAESKATRLWSY